ncbi:MAG: HAD family phosphatase [Chloroflexi bacterium]|jgi:Cof subfamily protein (haloacid dehalogenase superfamily)|nr:HAD family phosphatase [Chloroflexota bacterium]
MPHAPNHAIRLIVADLDGTLLNADHVVTPLTERALREAMAQGVQFTLATGKTFASTRAVIAQFGLHLPLVCGNGTLVHAPDGTILYRDPIPLEVVLESIEFGRQASMKPIVYSGAHLLAELWDENVQVLVDHHEPAPIIVSDLPAALRGPYPPDKLVFMNESDLEGVAAFQIALEERFAGRAQVVRSGVASLVELMPCGVSKGTALAFILDYTGFKAEEVIAFGDNCNDLEMIKLAGIGVAMGHAPEDVRRDADYVTGTNNADGVGHALYKFVLPPRMARSTADHNHAPTQQTGRHA